MFFHKEKVLVLFFSLTRGAVFRQCGSVILFYGASAS
jgi:hypothetical protein